MQFAGTKCYPSNSPFKIKSSLTPEVASWYLNESLKLNCSSTCRSFHCGGELPFPDPTIGLQTVKLMKEGLEAAGLKAHLMSQPLASTTLHDCGKQGFIRLYPEFPFGKKAIL